MANLTILCRRPNLSESAQQKGSSEAAYSTNAVNLTNMANLTIFRQRLKHVTTEFEKCGEFGKMANLTIFRRRPKFGRMRSNFGKNGEFNDISPKPEI